MLDCWLQLLDMRIGQINLVRLNLGSATQDPLWILIREGGGEIRLSPRSAEKS